MQDGRRIKINPLTILSVWIVAMIILTPVFMFISNIGASGGEQKPLTTLATMLVVTLIGSSVICFVTPFISKSWTKSNKGFFVLTILFAMPTAIFVWQYFFIMRYASVEKSRTIDGNKIEINTEYYDYDNNVVRSNSYWKNGKRDSLWTVFSKNGKIISKKLYKNDTLVLKM